MNLKQIWSIIRGRQTNFSWMNASWAYYPDGDPIVTKQRRLGMHATTYDYLKPTDDQMAKMAEAREAAKVYGEALERILPDGPDKTFAIRAHRSNAMWANVAITRQPDGAPRT